jgi:leucyl-tRNA synthetase
MSKSRGNVINPDEIIATHGADTLRLYEVFLGPLDAMKPWSTNGIEGVVRFLKKVWNACIGDDGNAKAFQTNMPEGCQMAMNVAIKKVGDDIKNLKFNTAISQMMICLNTVNAGGGFDGTSIESFIKILAPFAPHICEELWARLGNCGSVSAAPWPSYDAAKVDSNIHTIVVQVNGKVRSEFTVNDRNRPEDEIFALAMASANVAKFMAGRTVIKKVYAGGKIVNFVVE